MSPSPTLSLPARARRVGRIALPGLLVAGLAAGTLTAVAASSGSASAAAARGTFTIGATPIAVNQPTDPGIGALAPSADAAANGMFGPQLAWPVIPLQAALSRNGNLVTYGTPLDTAEQGGLVYDVWDTSAGAARSAHTDTPSMHDYNSFCNALVTLDDGRLLMVGGNSDMNSMVFDPTTGTQTMGSNLAQSRWYTTSLRLPDGRIAVLGGAQAYYSTVYLNPDDNNSHVATTPEIGTGTGDWTQLTGATSLYAFGAESNRWWYPRAFNGPNGTVVGLSGDHIWTLSTAGKGTLQQYGNLPFQPGVSGSQVMYEPGKILVAGGGQMINSDDTVATNAAAVVDVTGAAAKVTATAAMANARNWLNLTVLPNGEVLANGGTRVGTQAGDANSVKQAEIWNPATGTWRTAATAQRTRTYHSTSLLLPSGAVFTGGGGVPGPEDNLNAELYYPAYLFTKNADGTTTWASRPAISTIAGNATYGGQITLGIADGRTIGSASLISSAVVTHGQNTDQRRIPLTITQKNGTVTATLPGSMNTMPAGDYELTVVDGNGVPSAAQMITVRRDGAGMVTVGAGDTAPITNPGDTDGDHHTGTAAPADPGTPAAPGTPAGSSGTPEGTVALTIDRSVGLEATSKFGYRIGHSGATTVLQHVHSTNTAAARSASAWSARTGLASANGWSFEAVDKAGYYLVAPTKAGGRLRLERNDGTKGFAGRATFAAVHGATGQNTSFQVWSHRDWYVRHQGNALIAQKLDTSDRGRADSAFSVRAGYSAAPRVPVTAGRSVSLQPSDAAGQSVKHSGARTLLQKVGAGSSWATKSVGSWIVRTGLGSKRGVSFESVDRPGWFLAAPAKGTGALTLVKRVRSASFAARATFTSISGVSGHDRSFRLTSNTKLYLRHLGAGLVVRKLDTTKGGRAATTFVVGSGLAPAPTR